MSRPREVDVQPVPMIRARALHPLLRYVERSGIPPMHLSGPRWSSLTDGNALVPLSFGGDLWEAATQLVGSEDLAFHVATAFPMPDASDLAAIAARSQTLAVAFDRILENAGRFNSGQRFWLVHRDEESELHWRYASALARGRQPVNDYVAMLLVQLVRLAAGPGWRPLEIAIESPGRRDAEVLESMCVRGVRFGQASMALVLPRQLLALRLPPAAPAPSATDDSLPDLEFAGSVRQMVESLLRIGAPDLTAAARAAGVSVRSFQRRLDGAGLQFAELLQQARFEAACRMLRDPDAKVIEVSAALGYRDSANFTRAFRRWAGVPPQAFRRAAGSSVSAAGRAAPPAVR